MSIELPPPPSRRNGVCTDDRGLLHGFYIAGGAEGATRVADGANEIGRIGIAGTRAPLHKRAEILAKEATNFNIQLRNHAGCAARLGARAIGKTIHDMKLAELQAGSELLLGRQLPAKTLRKAQIYLGNPDNYSPLSPDDAYEYMNAAGIPNHEIRNERHQAKQLVVEHRNGTFYDIINAWELDEPGYGFSPDGTVDFVDTLNDTLPTATEETTLAVASGWQFGVMMNLPHGGDEAHTGVLLGHMPFDVVHL